MSYCLVQSTRLVSSQCVHVADALEQLPLAHDVHIVTWAMKPLPLLQRIPCCIQCPPPPTLHMCVFLHSMSIGVFSIRSLLAGRSTDSFMCISAVTVAKNICVTHAIATNSTNILWVSHNDFQVGISAVANAVLDALFFCIGGPWLMRGCCITATAACWQPLQMEDESNGMDRPGRQC